MRCEECGCSKFECARCANTMTLDDSPLEKLEKLMLDQTLRAFCTYTPEPGVGLSIRCVKAEWIVEWKTPPCKTLKEAIDAAWAKYEEVMGC